MKFYECPACTFKIQAHTHYMNKSCANEDCRVNSFETEVDNA